MLWPNFHCFKRVDCQFTVVKEFDSNFKINYVLMIMIKEQRQSFYNLVFQKTVVNMYYPKTHFN